IGEVAERMRHAGRYENDLIGPDRVGGAVGREGSLASAHDIDVIGLRVPVHAAARAAGDQAVGGQVDLLGPDAGVDPWNLLATPVVHRCCRARAKIENFQHGFLLTLPSLTLRSRRLRAGMPANEALPQTGEACVRIRTRVELGRRRFSTATLPWRGRVDRRSE